MPNDILASSGVSLRLLKNVGRDEVHVVSHYEEKDDVLTGMSAFFSPRSTKGSYNYKREVCEGGEWEGGKELRDRKSLINASRNVVLSGEVWR